MELEWASFKSFSANRNLLMQYVENDSFYNLYSFDGPLIAKCILNKDASSDTIDFEQNFKSTCNKPLLPTSKPAYSSKTWGVKKLYKRVCGSSHSVSSGSNTILLTVSYAWVKFTEIQIVNCEAMDYVTLQILDSTTGTYTTVPNYILNTFATSVFLPKDFYTFKSDFDADLYVNMQIKITMNSNSAKTVGINLVFDEVK